METNKIKDEVIELPMSTKVSDLEERKSYLVKDGLLVLNIAKEEDWVAVLNVSPNEEGKKNLAFKLEPVLEKLLESMRVEPVTEENVTLACIPLLYKLVYHNATQYEEIPLEYKDIAIHV